MRENEDIAPLMEDGLTKNEFICSWRTGKRKERQNYWTV